MENALGVQLIERTSKSALITEPGKLIIEHARDILCKVDTIKEVAKQAKDPYAGECRLGIIPTLAPYLLPHIMPSLSKKFPKLTLYLMEEQTPRLLEMLKQGKLDAAILALPSIDEDVIPLPLFEEEFMLAVYPQHSFSKRKIIKTSDLKNETLLLLSEGHCMRHHALEFCSKMKASEAKGFQATSLETLRHMVASKAGMTLIPKLACKANDGVYYLAFHSSKPIRLVGMVLRPSSAKKMLIKEIAEQIRKCLHTQKGIKVMN